MVDQNVLRHGMYALSIIILFNRFVSLLAQHFALSNTGNIILFGGLGITAFILGMFSFRKSLGYGLAIGGSWCAGYSLFHYQFQLTESVRFVLSLVMLAIVLYALHIFRQKKNSSKKGK